MWLVLTYIVGGQWTINIGINEHKTKHSLFISFEFLYKFVYKYRLYHGNSDYMLLFWPGGSDPIKITYKAPSIKHLNALMGTGVDGAGG